MDLLWLMSKQSHLLYLWKGCKTCLSYYKSYFLELLRKETCLTIYQSNLKLLVVEMFKVKIEAVPDIMKKIIHGFRDSLPVRKLHNCC